MKKQSRPPVLLEKMQFKITISVKNNKILVDLRYLGIFFSSEKFNIFISDLEAIFYCSRVTKETWSC